jgi:hypothetical protein
MEINIDNRHIHLKPEIISINQCSASVFNSENDFVRPPEVKNILFNLHINIEKDSWQIPYLVVLRKENKERDEYEFGIKDENESEIKEIRDFTEPNHELKSESEFNYTKNIYLNKPYFKIFSTEFDETLFQLINMIATFSELKIPKDEYECINKESFFGFTSNQIENCYNEGEFVIREYRYPDLIIEDLEKFNDQSKADKWQLPIIDYEQAESDLFKVFHLNTVVNDIITKVRIDSVLLIVPRNYYSKYRPNFELVNTIILKRNKYQGKFFNNYLGADIYHGTLKDCLSLLNDKKRIGRLRFDIIKSRQKTLNKNIS